MKKLRELTDAEVEKLLPAIRKKIASDIACYIEKDLVRRAKRAYAGRCSFCNKPSKFKPSWEMGVPIRKCRRCRVKDAKKKRGA